MQWQEIIHPQFADIYAIEYQDNICCQVDIYSKNGTFFMGNSGNNTILPLPSCEEVELFNLFQKMELFIPGDANCGERCNPLSYWPTILC
ncbi:hypothetical protein [Chitinophaga sp. HK235]|uniref:hypothetical protein n=1 Tax=Chitinophaga sp. HK235 TaxID=2952571 RepID=UPI001BAC9005|nr:hypothetical protein [Chitinophaga sp. HK235]